MKIQRILGVLLMLLAANTQAQTSYGGEIVSYQTFGEGMMVTRAKVVRFSGTVSNFFFFNRSDEPWNGNVWYEYDWEIRGKYPYAGWSQIRVRDEPEIDLEDAPVDVTTTTILSNELVHYILIRKDNQYVYDIRKDFDASTYDYNDAAAHNSNSASLLADGPRTYQTGDELDHIPSWKQLDFSMGITAFEEEDWTGYLPEGDYSKEMVVDFTRFYAYSGNSLNPYPQWSDEFNGNSLDYGKWYAANWSFRATQFRAENVRVQDGYLYLKINRGNSGGNNTVENLALYGTAIQSSTEYGSVASRANDGNTSGDGESGLSTHTQTTYQPWWEVRLVETSTIEEIILFNRTNCCSYRLSDYTVSILDDNGNTVFSGDFSDFPDPHSEIDVGGVIGRTVRVQLNGTKPLSLAEVQVMGVDR